jgi:CHAT domain-containing protein
VPQVALVESLVRQAKISMSLRKTEEAWAELTTASQIAEISGSSLRSEKLRILYSETVQKVYDEMMSFQWRQRHDGESALAIAERARAFPRSVPVHTRWNAPEDGVAVAYTLLPDRLLIWVIDDGGVSTFERKVSSHQVEDRISRFLGEIRCSGPELRSISGELHDLLLPKPVTQIAGDKVLYFIPDRALNRVPFAALLNPRTGHFLVQDHPVALARSVAGLRELRPVPQARPSVSVVNPDFDRKSFPECAALEGAQAETAFVSSAFPNCRIMSGNLPTSGRVLDELDRVDTFIFVGHSVTNSNLPSRSCLLVAPSTADRRDTGILAGEEIANHKFAHLNLVVLSGCATVGPTTARSGNLAGVAARFLDAGAHAVVGTLWPLNDSRALPVLSPFYRELADGVPQVLALRDAQIEALERSPERVADWADFVAVVN